MRFRLNNWALVFVGSVFLAGTGWTHPPTDPIKPGGHPTGHVADKPEGMTWPPQPPGISNVRDLSDYSGQSRRQLERDLKFSNLERQFASVGALKPLMGRRMTRLSIEEIPEKTPSAKVERRFHYFDRQLNSTVTVVERRDGSYDRQVTPATQYQPDISEDEGNEAIALAKSYFTQRGMARAQTLKGFAIQAYPPARPGFFDGRVVYVSLHVGSDSPPEYLAWVDLTRQTIVAARQEPQR